MRRNLEAIDGLAAPERKRRRKAAVGARDARGAGFCLFTVLPQFDASSAGQYVGPATIRFMMFVLLRQ
jgi:hypothetical protein